MRQVFDILGPKGIVNFKKYSLQNSILCEENEFADIVYRINSQLLFFKLGGRLRMEIAGSVNFLEPLFFV
jgi:hypothetical protein